MSSATLAELNIIEFEETYGAALLDLACHAAIPVVLNSEFLHLLRINFFWGVDPTIDLTYISEIELLMSDMIDKIGSVSFPSASSNLWMTNMTSG